VGVGVPLLRAKQKRLFIHHFSIINRGFNLEVQQGAVCHFAPEGRDVYSPALLFLNRTLRRSAMSYGYLASDSAARYISLLKEREII
jgi:hypothetical protein